MEEFENVTLEDLMDGPQSNRPRGNFDDPATRDEVEPSTGERIAWDREESDSCERGTPGCSIHHTRDSECQTW
jgi:hypothetical protein